MAEKIEIDYKSGAILFKHENEMKYPLFYMSNRSRGIHSKHTKPNYGIRSDFFYGISTESWFFQYR